MASRWWICRRRACPEIWRVISGHWGAERKEAQRNARTGSGEAWMMTSSGHWEWTSWRPLTSTRRSKWWKKSAPSRGTDTGARRKFHKYTLNSDPQEKRRGIILVPLHCIGVPSAVSNLTPSEEVDAGPGSTETKAPESTRKSLSDRISLRNNRDEQQTSCSSGKGAGTETGTEPASWTRISTCRTASFPRLYTVFCSWQPCLCVSCDTSTDPEKKLG